MSALLRMALRNVARNRRRTLITSAAVAAGVGLLVLSEGFVDGLNESVLRTQVDSLSGHVVLHPPRLGPEVMNNPVDGLEPVPPELLQSLEPYDWAPRLVFDLTLSNGVDGLRARGLGMDPKRDEAVFPRDRWQLEGEWSAQGVVLGARVARLLEVQVGDTVVLQVRTAAGAYNALSYPVSGVVKTRNAVLDNYFVMMPLEPAMALVQADGPSQVALRLASRGDAQEVADSLAGPWRASTFHAQAAEVIALMETRRRALQVFVATLMLIAALGIANTVIMATYERIREIGTLAALGMGRGRIRALFLLEGAVMGLGAALIGGVVGGGVNRWLSVHGVDLSGVSEQVGVNLPFDTTLYTRFSLVEIGFAVLFGVVVAVAASLYPAHLAAQLNPAEAVRAR